MTGTYDILERLIAFDTVSAQSNLALIDYVQDFLAQRGFRITRISDPETPKAGLYAEIGPDGAGVLLSGHTDVVPVVGQTWTRDPFRLTVEGDKLFGRGTTDMKGFVAAMLTVADVASRADLNEPLKLVLSYDEEIGCVGIARMMDRLAPLLGKPRLAIVGEPTQMRVAIGHKGKQAYRATITGEAGHSAMAPRFVNALNVAAEFVTALTLLQTDLAREGTQDPDYEIPYSTVHVGTLSGGHALNIVPDHAEMTFEVRHLPADNPAEIADQISQIAERIIRRYGPPAQIDIAPISTYPGLATPRRSPVVDTMLQLAGTDTTKVAFGTEAGFFDGLGIPTIVCGPGSMAGQGHKADEFLLVSEMRACDALLARLLQTMQR